MMEVIHRTLTMHQLAAVLLVATLVLGSQDADPNVVVTSAGRLRGSVMQSRGGRDIHAFRGIPYARAPIGSLRFQPPEPTEEWEGVRNATEDGASCPQPYEGFPLPTSEDCLFLNVYTSALKAHPKHPVMVFFHPGGWFSGTGSSQVYGPQYLLDHDIVLVTLNFRLTALGFLSTGDGEIPGNNGLKDQVMVLRWVRDNIAAFGGDPGRVTITGYSVGGYSVLMHMVSPMSRGLFHSGIAMSGAPMPQQPQSTDPLPLARRQAALLGCPTETTRAIATCLRGKDANDITRSFMELRDWGYDPMMPLFPVLETSPRIKEKFFPDDAVKLLAEGNFQNVPLLIGITKDEFKAIGTLLENQTMAEDMDRNFEHVFPIAFHYERDTDRSRTISRELRRAYLGNRTISNETTEQVGELYADSIIGFPAHRAARLVSAKSSQPVYYYRFSYQGRISHVYKEDEPTVPFGVVHHDDLLYLFNVSVWFPSFGAKDPEYQTSLRETQMWVDFMRTGNPTPKTNEWLPFTASQPNYMDIGNNLEMKTRLYEDRYRVWDELFP